MILFGIEFSYGVIFFLQNKINSTLYVARANICNHQIPRSGEDCEIKYDEV
jgi:hypothetical protein